MICIKCGKEIKDGANFCNFCGAKNIVRDDDKMVSPAFSKRKMTNSKKHWILGVVVILLLCVIIGAVILLSGNQRNAETVTQRFDKYLIFEDHSQNVYLLKENNIYETNDTVQIADDGTIAYINALGKLDVIKENSVLQSDLTVKSFILSKDGSTIALTSNGNDSYYWQLSNDTCKLISNKYSPYLISDNGKTVSLGGGYSVYGGEPVEVIFGSIRDVSPDGNLVYYNKIYTRTTNEGEANETKEEVSAICVQDTRTGNAKEILKYTDPDYSGYLVATNDNADEMIFGFNNDFYYYSYQKNKVEKITGLQSVEYVLSLDSVSPNNAFEYNYYDDSLSIFEWIRYISFPYIYEKTNRSNAILGNIYCLLNEDNTVSLAILNNECSMEIIANNIIGNLAFSENRSIIWCISNNTVCYIDITNDTPHLVQTLNKTATSVEGVGLQPHLSTTSDGSLVLFIGDDGYSYCINKEDMVSHKMIEHAAFSWISCDNDLFVLSNIDNEDHIGGDLYCLPHEKITSYEMSYQKSKVVDLKLTTNKTYVIVGDSETCDIYEKKGQNYSIVANNINTESVHTISDSIH